MPGAPHVEPPRQPLTVDVVTRDRVQQTARWRNALCGERKDHRYYELVEDTLHPEFDYRYFVIRDAAGEARGVQPFFLLDQDLLVGLTPRFGKLIERMRRLWAGFMSARTLMVGCAAGEAHLDGAPDQQRAIAALLASSARRHARALGAQVIAFKEFPARYRPMLECLTEQGFTRIPSLPMTKLSIDYASFEDYMNRALNSATRRKLRRKFEATKHAAPIELSVVADVTPVIADVYPLYLQVYRRSKLHFEKLTEGYFCALGQRMPDKARFFLWRQRERIIAFAACLAHGDAIYSEYIGLDYDVAIDLHLYHYIFRDIISWAIANGYKSFRSTGLNYDPKLHLRQQLDPLDLYVRHTSDPINAVLRRALPLIEPTQYDPTLAKFNNYLELWH